MNDFLEQTRWNKVVYGILLVAIGAILFIFPDQISKMISTVIAVLFVAIGLGIMVTYFAGKVDRVVGGGKLVAGTAFLVFGIYVFRHSELIISIIPFILGLIVVVSGVDKLQNFFDLKRLKYEGGIVTLIFAIINIALGIVLIINPFEAAIVLFKVIGVGLIFSGITDLIATIMLQKRVKDYMSNNETTKKADFIEADFVDAEEK